MNLSDASSIFTIALGVITVFIWLSQLYGWFSKSYSQAKQASELSRKVSAQLIDKATNAERRADIHLYLVTIAIESNARKVRSNAMAHSLGILLFISVLFFSAAARFLEINIYHPLVIISIIFSATWVISFLMALWFSSIISKLDDSWNDGFKTALLKKIDKHLAE